MHRSVFTISVLVLLGLVAYSQEEYCSKALTGFSKTYIDEGAIKAMKRGEEFTSDYDLKYHRLEWEINPDTLFIKGVITSYFLVKTTYLNSINFDMDTSLQIDSIIYHGANVTFKKHDFHILEISLPDTLYQGELDSISVFYHGIPNAGGLGSIIKSMHADIPIIWTLSEPYGAKDWWPCKQNLNDKIDSIDIIVVTGKEYRVASNGILISEKLSGDNKIYHWKHRYPIAAYLIAIAVTKYSVFSDYVHYNGDSLEILNYIYPEDSANFRQKAKMTIPIMELFMNLFGEYPFIKEKYGHAQFGRGGMEHQTMSFMVNLSENLIAHELAHQWFGDKITCNSWQNIWLNEGFARYSEGLLAENLHSEQDWYDWKQTYINSVTKESSGSVFIYGEDTSDVYRIFHPRLSYNKGAMVLHVLRWVIGDSAFFQGIRSYMSDPGLAYSYAGTEDLQRVFESVSNMDLTEFFKDWVYMEGFPSYQIYWDQKGNSVNLTIDQTQSHMSVDFFELPVPIQFIGEGNDSIVVFNNEYSGQIFKINLDFHVDTVIFDTHLRILSRFNSVKELERVPSENHFMIYPNPGKENFSIEFTDNNTIVYFVEVIDLNGRYIERKDFENKSFERGSKISLDIMNHKSGIYIIRVVFEGGTYVAKIVKI